MSSVDLRSAASRVPQLLVPGAIGVLIVLYIIALCVGGCSDPEGTPSEETNCGDGVDNDGDGDTDCFDADCEGKDPCGSEEAPGHCDDGIDNDADGDIDCDDVDCAGFPGCDPG